MTLTVTGPCVDCGAEVSRDLPDDERFERILRGVPLICDGCVEVREAADEARRVREAEEARQQLAFARVRASGLPARHHHRLSTLGLDARLLAAAASWVHDGRGLLLTGPVGVGKTTVAGAACFERLQQRPAVWTSAPLLFARLGTGLGSQQRDWALDLLAGRSALVLDDIDKARPTEYGAEQVFLAIDQRVEHEAPLLVTSNQAPSELAARWPEPYGEAIASRLVGYCATVRMDGADRRTTAQPPTPTKGAAT